MLEQVFWALLQLAQPSSHFDHVSNEVSYNQEVSTPATLVT